MALSPSSMASYIYGHVQGSQEASVAISKFYQALCSYCEENMEVQYSWAATTPSTPSPIPDPITLLSCKIKTSGSLSPSGATTPEAALSKFAADLNSQISGWQVIWPTGFVLQSAFILPAIVFTPSMATTPEEAWEHIAKEIIAGITVAATPGPLLGTHGIYTVPTPGAIFSKIL